MVLPHLVGDCGQDDLHQVLKNTCRESLVELSQGYQLFEAGGRLGS